MGGAVKRGAKAVGGAVKAVGKKALAPVMRAAKALFRGLKIPFKRILGSVLKAPVIAPLIEGFMINRDVKKFKEQRRDGEIDQEEFENKVGKRSIEAVGGLIGSAGGAVLGSLGGPIGTIAGSVLGDVLGRWASTNVVSMMGGNFKGIGQWMLRER